MEWQELGVIALVAFGSVGWAHFAIRGQEKRVGEKLESAYEAWNTRFEDWTKTFNDRFSEVRQDIKNSEDRLRGEIKDVKTDLHREIEEVKSRLPKH